MFVAPGGQRVVNIDQLFRKLIQSEPAVGIAIDLEPGSGGLLCRPVLEVEAARSSAPCAASRRLVAPSAASIAARAAAPLRILFEEVRLLEPKPKLDLAELLDWKPDEVPSTLRNFR